MRPSFLLVCLAVTTASCYHVYYAPNTPNAPLLSKKGETRVNILYCSGGDSKYNGGEVQAACAVSENIGVMANFFSAGKTEEVYDYSTDRYYNESGKGSYVEFAGGYFRRFAKTRWIGEAYAGAGFGSVKNEYGREDYSKVGIFKFFIQPAIGYKVKNFEFVVVPKLSYVNWDIKESDIAAVGNEGHHYDMNYIDSRKNFLAFEPALLIRFGGEEVKIQSAVSFSGYNRYKDGPLRETLNMSLGISLDIRSKK